MTPPETQRRKLVVLLVAGGSLTAAFVAGPELLLASRCPGSCDPQALGSALAPALAGFVEQSSPSPAEGLVQLVDLWLWWHATKVVISALLLVVCALLGVEVWRRHASAGRRASGWWALTGIVVMVVSVLVAGLFALNVQATAVPLVALLPLLAEGPDAVGAAAGQVRAAVTNSTETSVSAPVRVLVDSVAHYDWTMAGVAGALAVVAAASAMLAMRQRRRCTPIQRRTRVRSSASGVVAAFAVVLFGGVCAGSVVAALDPLSSLQGLLGVG